MRTARALRRNLGSNGDTFPHDLAELISYFRGTSDNGVRAIPGTGLNVPLYLLGSSDFSARLAAELGLPFGFASHFAPEYLHVALAIYRGQFEPSDQLAAPHAIVGVNVVAADTDDEARRLFTSLQQQFLNLIRGTPTLTPPPLDTMDGRWNPAEQAGVERMIRYSVVGSQATVRAGLERILDDTAADELILTGSAYDHAARLHSLEIAADAIRQINADRTKSNEALPTG
jgi:luciferase family oxidoreductase group 1